MKTAFYAILAISLCKIMASAAEIEPFQLSIVPENCDRNSSSITFGEDSKREFFVVLTNNATKAHPVFEQWNSWGYQSISFELIFSSGEKAKILVKPKDFTRNFPSIYLIPPKGHQVFPTLNDEWEVIPKFGKPGRTKVKLKAVYAVPPTTESKEEKVWTGRIESETLDIDIYHQ